MIDARTFGAGQAQDPCCRIFTADHMSLKGPLLVRGGRSHPNDAVQAVMEVCSRPTLGPASGLARRLNVVQIYACVEGMQQSTQVTMLHWDHG